MDIELMKSCYWPEAIEKLEDTITGMFQYNGKAWDFAPIVMEVFSNFNRTQHRLSSILTQLDGDKATAARHISLLIINLLMKKVMKKTSLWVPDSYISLKNETMNGEFNTASLYGNGIKT
jgi:hypothetical protein